MMVDHQFEDVVLWKRVRYLVLFLIALGFMVIYMMRTALSIAIVAMTSKKNSSDFEIFDWSLSTQGTILSSFFWGYLPTNIPGAVLIQRYGCRWVLIITTLIGSIATILIPVGAQYGGWEAACALRIIQGASQGPFFAAFHSASTKWLPPAEKTKVCTFVLTGGVVGIILVMASGGVLADGGGGWPSIFYVCGSLSLAWCVLFYFMGYSCPSDHPFISDKERTFIESQLSPPTEPSFYVPWMSIVKSVPVWALCLVYIAHSWGFYMLLTEMPTYINNILKYDIKDNGFLSALPYLGLTFSNAIFGFLADWVQRYIPWVQGWIRRIFTALGFAISAISLGMLTVIDGNDKTAAIVLLVFGVSGPGAAIPGFQINQMDLSPRYAPILMAITNSVGNVISAVVPVAVSAIISDETDINDWYIVFWTSTAIYILGFTLYFVFGSEKLQPWNDAINETHLEDRESPICEKTSETKRTID